MTITATSPDRLPQWKGHPVPWVARWTGEIISDAAAVATHPTGMSIICYRDGRETREPDTQILWIREGIGRTGDPIFGDVNTYRQKASMRRRLCQVCGDKITDDVIQWLLPKAALEVDSKGETVTNSPPTCAACIPLALDLCPHFKAEGYVILRVLEYSMWGVGGDIGYKAADGQLIHTRGRVSYEQPMMFSVICARQQVARLDKFVVAEEH